MDMKEKLRKSFGEYNNLSISEKGSCNGLDMHYEEVKIYCYYGQYLNRTQ